MVSAQETKGIPAAHAATVCPRKSQERERRRRRETADKAAEERQFETGLPHTFCLRDLNLVLIIIKIRPRYPCGDGVEGGLEVITHISELAPAVEVRPTSRRAVDLEPVLQ